MVKGLQDLWIMDETGITLFSRVYDEKMNAQFFGAVISALNKFAENITEGGLTHFELKDKRFSFLKVDNLIFVANSDPKKINEKKALAELEGISDIFFKEYGEVLKDWNNDISIFEDFEKKIKDSLEEVIKKFQQAFW